MGEYEGLLVDGSVIIYDIESARSLYSRGFYGTPIGVEKPKGADFETPLKLSLIEALYLAEKGVLSIKRVDGTSVTVEDLIRQVKETPRLELLYTVYRDLRDRNLIVRSGLKFGSDFTVYRVGPGLEHAPFIVHVHDAWEKLDPTDIVRAGRISHSVKKTFIMAFPERGGKITYMMFRWIRL
ncbi:MAG: tRNA-intron lyase [Thermoprotei archaeon]|nr:tRNA-intron lyase [Thermoprotei archaeon]